MSFALASIKVKPELSSNVTADVGEFGVPEVMKHGLTKTINDDVLHPLINSERNHYKNRDAMNMAVLRNIQGLHAPLKIAMELKAAKQIGRLPFLTSSNIMHDVLTGRDLEIQPEDIFNMPEFQEISGQPHAMVEKSLGF